MRVELNAKPFDPLTTDQSDVENELQSGSSILVLESTLSRHSHCRALFCLWYKLTGIINIKSDYRFNLKDLTRRRSGDLSHYLRKSHWSRLSRSWPSNQTWEPNRYCHVTCLEHILCLQSLLESKYIVIEGETVTYNTQGLVVLTTTRFCLMIKD